MEERLLNYFNGDELAASVWQNKYAAEGEKTPEDMFRRIAKEFARIENKYSNPIREDEIYGRLDKFKYIIPGGSVLASCGTGKLASLSNCFVIAGPKDSYSSIMDTRKTQVQLMKRRGGVGYDLSHLRPNGAAVDNAAVTSTGAPSFMDVNSALTNEVALAGRRGALMLTLSINHPDIVEFIEKKQDLTKVTGANISVKVTDAFMEAVENDDVFLLKWPVDCYINESLTEELNNLTMEEMEYNKLYNMLYTDKFVDSIVKPGYMKKVRAKDIWNKIIHCAWNTAEPGIIFNDAMLEYAPDSVYKGFEMVSTNPCGEIGMGENDSCRLIHINLSSMILDPYSDIARVDWEQLAYTIKIAMRMGDDLVDLEIEAVDKIISKCRDQDDFNEAAIWTELKDTAIKGRRCGVGILGLADMIAKLNIMYGSSESIEKVDEIMKFIFDVELQTDIELAKERGAFPAWESKIEQRAKTKWYNYVRESLIWEELIRYGRRNISFSTIAPTGSVAILAGTSSGIEPVFMPYYTRRRKCVGNEEPDYVDKMGIAFKEFVVVHPEFKNYVTCCLGKDVSDWKPENWEEAFKKSPWNRATAQTIPSLNRVMLQSICQRYITHSISSTINLPKETTEKEISDIYFNSWKQGCKGNTVYRDGCREGILNALGKKKEDDKFIEATKAPKRPKELPADFYCVKVKGEIFYVMVGLYKGRPYEIFAFKAEGKINDHSGKLIKVRKGLYSFVSDIITVDDLDEHIWPEQKAVTILASISLRHGIPLKFINKTIKKVDLNVTSFASAICRVLSKYDVSEEEQHESCSECGGKLIREGGCIRCLECSYSKCL